MGNSKALIERIHKLRSEGYTAARIAETLNSEGWTTPMQLGPFNDRLIRMMLTRYGTVARGPRRPPSDDLSECWLSSLAKEIGMPRVTLYGWARRGWIQCRREKNRWIAQVTSQELVRLRRMSEGLAPSKRPQQNKLKK